MSKTVKRPVQEPDAGHRKRLAVVFRLRCVLLAILLFLPVWLEAQEAKPVKIAVLFLAPVPNVMMFTDVLIAELTKNTPLQVMERAELNRVLGEQSLSLGSVNGSVQAGKLLGVDGLVICELRKIEQEERLVARLVAVKPGVVIALYSKTVKGDELLIAAKELRERFTPYWQKLELTAGQAIPISLLNLRSAAATPEALQTEQTLNAMLFERLLSDPNLLVLERRQLDSLTWEKELMGVADSPFWNGSYFLEGTIDPQELSQTEVTIACQLRSKNRAEPITVKAKGPRGQPAIAISELLRKILAELKKETGGTAWSAEQEAKRYLEEAKWAYRWKLYREAQEAAESSWALGLRTEELELLRLFAYIDPARTINFTGYSGEKVVSVSNSPDPKKFAPLMRSLELYVQGTLSRRQTGRELGYEWYGVGCEVVQHSARLLQRFWSSSPEEKKREAKPLQDLRGAIRQTVELMEQDEKVRQPGWPNYAKTISPASVISGFDQPHNLHWVKYRYGVFWQEKPEDTIAMYRQMLGSPVREMLLDEIAGRQGESPNLIDWQKDDPASLTQKWQKYTGEMMASTNVAEKMLGFIMNVQGTTGWVNMSDAEVLKNGQMVLQTAENYQGPLASETGRALRHAGERVIHVLLAVMDRYHHEKKPTAVLQELRGKLGALDRKIGAALVEDYREKKKKKDEDEERLAKAEIRKKTNELIVSLKKRLKEAQKVDISISNDIRAIQEKGDADELMPYAVEYNQRVGTAFGHSMVNHLRTRQGLPALPYAKQVLPKGPPPATNLVATGIPPIKKLLPEDIKFNVRQFHTADFPPLEGHVLKNQKLVSIRHRENKVWVEMDADFLYDQGGTLSEHVCQQSAIASIDLKNGSRTTYPLAHDRRDGLWITGRLEKLRSFEVHQGILYYTEPSRLVRVDVNTQQIRRLPIPIESRASLFAIGANVYLTTQDGILEFNPRTEVVRTLVSTRRRPEVTFLDALEKLNYPPVLAGPPGFVRTYLNQKVYECELTTGKWQEIATASHQIVDLRSSLPTDPMLVTQWGGMGLPTAHGLPAQERNFQYLLGSDYKEGPRSSVNIRSGPQLMPRWRSLSFTGPFFAHWDRFNLLAHFNTPQGLAKECYHFDARFSDPAKLIFTYQEKISAPQAAPNDGHTILLPTPDGLVLATESGPGFWLVPRAELDQALAASRKAIAEATEALEREETDLYDLNRNGKLEADEEKSMAESMEHFYALVRFRLNLWIQLYDKNGDDQLDGEEVQQLYNDPFLPRTFTEQIKKTRLEKLDANRNGKYDIQELWEGLLDPVMKESYYRTTPTSRPRQSTN